MVVWASRMSRCMCTHLQQCVSTREHIDSIAGWECVTMVLMCVCVSVCLCVLKMGEMPICAWSSASSGWGRVPRCILLCSYIHIRTVARCICAFYSI